jgi:hypothetical protein
MVAHAPRIDLRMLAPFVQPRLWALEIAPDESAKSNLWSSCRKYQGASALNVNRYILTGNHYYLQIETAKANLRIREYAVEKDDAFYDIIDCAAFATGCRCQPVLASAKVASAGLRNEFQYSPCSAY